MDGDTLARLGYLLLLVVAVGGWLLVEFRGRLGAALRMGAGWGLIFLGVMAGYGLWQDVGPGLMPRQSVMQDGGIEIPRSPDGHYYVTLTVSGTPITFLADTGASNVVLTRADAELLGFDTERLAFLGEAQTANGPVRTALVQLQDVTLGPVTDARLPAYVNDGEMFGSLLGMDFLGRFDIRISSDRMILTR